VVVGGGPAGLEAARVAAKRGADVVLMERRPYLGGLMKAKANLPGRDVYQQQIDWWERQALELGVDVRVSVEATAETVLAEGPDAVILATGSSYDATGSCGWNVNPIPGADKPHVYTADDILLDGQRPTGTVVIFDSEGISTGPGVAELLGAQGAKCLIVSPSAPGSALAEAPDALARLAGIDVTILAQTYLSAIGDGDVTLAPVLRDSENLLAGRLVGDGYTQPGVDAVVLAAMRKPANTSLEADLDGKVDALYVIGDGLAPRDLRAATYEGQLFARLVGEKDAPKTTGDYQFAPVSPEAFEYLGPAEALLDQPLAAPTDRRERRTAAAID
jgi:NADPH-dependent 2,4-dienoyl-CoA reductase/sulfur reductase-like enzyme